MKKTIVTTTIYEPSQALCDFANMSGWSLIIIGDKKTPNDSHENFASEHESVRFIAADEQESTYPELSSLIGWNNIQRRNIGFVEAVRGGANIIASIDDDNIPYKSWGKETLIWWRYKNTVKQYKTDDSICFDPLSVTNYPHLWHRGFPLQILSKRKLLKDSDYNCVISNESETFDIQADFWDGDPDIDAVCRMQFAPECDFNASCFPFTSDSMFSPFNSQNTFFSRRVMNNYFVFPHVGRMDDIWASYYVEALGYNVVYNKPTVYQDRNEQDLTKNLTDEFIGYENNERLLYALRDNPDNIKEFLPQQSWEAFMAYRDCFK